MQKKSLKKAIVVKPPPVAVEVTSEEEGEHAWEQGGEHGGGCLYNMEDCGRCDYCKVHAITFSRSPIYYKLYHLIYVTCSNKMSRVSKKYIIGKTIY